MDRKLTALEEGGRGVEGLSKKEKGLMGMGNSVMTVRWGGA